MKLVDYSDSERSDSEGEETQNSPPIPHSPPPAPKPHHAELPKRPVKRQIVVDLPKPTRNVEEPSPKRAKTEGSRGSGLFSVLPPPKRTKPVATLTSTNGAAKENESKEEVQAVVKGKGFIEGESDLVTSTSEPAPEPAVLPARTFMPRSAQAKKSKFPPKPAEETSTSATVSLFPLGPELQSKSPNSEATTIPSTYEPLIAQPITQTEDLVEEDEQVDSFVADTTARPSATSSSTLSTADLDSFAAHILEGRHRKNRTIQIMDYNAAEVYAQNAADKASGALQEQVAPVRAIGTGRHQLTQLLNNVQDQKESLEEQFAKHRRIKKESAAKYGW